MFVDAGWPCLYIAGFLQCLLACHTIERKKRKSSLYLSLVVLYCFTKCSSSPNILTFLYIYTQSFMFILCNQTWCHAHPTLIAKLCFIFVPPLYTKTLKNGHPLLFIYSTYMFGPLSWIEFMKNWRTNYFITDRFWLQKVILKLRLTTFGLRNLKMCFWSNSAIA